MFFNIRMGSAHALEKRQLTQTYLSHNELEQLEHSSNLVACAQEAQDAKIAPATISANANNILCIKLFSFGIRALE